MSLFWKYTAKYLWLKGYVDFQMGQKKWRHKANVVSCEQLVNLDERYTVLGTIFELF